MSTLQAGHRKMSRVVVQIGAESKGRKESHLLRETTLNLKSEIREERG